MKCDYVTERRLPNTIYYIGIQFCASTFLWHGETTIRKEGRRIALRDERGSGKGWTAEIRVKEEKEIQSRDSMCVGKKDVQSKRVRYLRSKAPTHTHTTAHHVITVQDQLYLAPRVEQAPASSRRWY